MIFEHGIRLNVVQFIIVNTSFSVVLSSWPIKEMQWDFYSVHASSDDQHLL